MHGCVWCNHRVNYLFCWLLSRSNITFVAVDWRLAPREANGIFLFMLAESIGSNGNNNGNFRFGASSNLLFWFAVKSKSETFNFMKLNCYFHLLPTDCSIIFNISCSNFVFCNVVFSVICFICFIIIIFIIIIIKIYLG